MKHLAFRLIDKSGQPQPLLNKNKEEVGAVQISSRFLSKLRSNSGQHSLEYTMILLLVMAGIILGGPYVVRSWNANLKGWEDSVIDSFDDPLLQAPDVVSIPGCTCTLTPGDPFGGGCGFGSCTATQLCDQWQCFPPGCGTRPPYSPPNPPIIDGTCICNCDPACCFPWAPTGLCGVNATNITCPDGTRENSRLCGCSSTPQYTCFSDRACVFNCEWSASLPVMPGNSRLCQPPDCLTCPDPWDAGLPADQDIVLVSACTNGNCELECIPPFFRSGNACGTCPRGTVVQGNCVGGHGTNLTCEEISPCPTGFCQAAIGGGPILPPPPPPCDPCLPGEGREDEPCCDCDVCTQSGMICNQVFLCCPLMELGMCDMSGECCDSGDPTACGGNPMECFE